MEYYKLLQLDREPFSNSPDPEYFFNSRQHMGCLQKLELALRLKRGLNVVIGDVGTGKTTLCRQLIRNFADDPEFETHLILDPAFESPTEFLHTICTMICSFSKQGLSHAEMKEMIKRSLFQSGVDAEKTTVLIIDEGQKISDECLEILRELLNYETNTYKLLQIVIFAQLEFNVILKTHANFADRINLLHHLKPLRFTDTKQLILHRLKLSSTTQKPATLFTLPALWAIYRASRGYPRKIIHLCHQSILALIIQNQTKAGWALIQSCKNRLSTSIFRKRNFIITASLACLSALLIIALIPMMKTRHQPILVPDNAVQNAFKIEPSSGSAAETLQKETVHRPQPETMTPMADKGQGVVTGSAPVETTNAPESIALPHESAPQAVAIKRQDPEPTPKPMPLTAPPDNLGQLIVQPGDTLSAMTLQIYGSRHNRFLRSVIAANPHIRNPNNIEIGHEIQFPALIQNPHIPQDSFFLIVLDALDSLTDVIQRAQEIRPSLNSKPILVSIWTPTDGLHFQLILNQYFASEQDARARIDMIPYAIAHRSKILSEWPKDTVFYSDPFKNNASLSFKARVDIEE